MQRFKGYVFLGSTGDVVLTGPFGSTGSTGPTGPL